MKVTEHNMDDCDLNADELDSIITLVKKEIKDTGDKNIQFYYAKMLGKLLGMRHMMDS